MGCSSTKCGVCRGVDGRAPGAGVHFRGVWGARPSTPGCCERINCSMKNLVSAISEEPLDGLASHFTGTYIL